MKIEPLYDNVVVKPLKGQDVTASGIVLPDSVDKDKPMEGEVVAVGQGRRMKDGSITPLAVKVGDKVLFAKYGPDEVEVDGEEYLVMSEDKIFGIIR